MILIPVKNLSSAKQRLASVLSQEVRTELARAMLLDELQTLAAWTNRPDVSLVTSDPFAIEQAERFEFEVILDHANRSETDAIEMATRVCELRGIQDTLIIPADIPLMQASELQKVLEAAPEQGSVLVPAGDGRGTNAAFRRPAGLFPLRFGNDSFKPHLAVARATGRPCTVLSFEGIGLDIDNSSDLLQLASAPGETCSQRLARRWSLRDLSLAVNE